MISVIVPIYKVEQYIAQCLDSIVNQTYKDLEILCIDDCGTDKSMEIVESYAAGDERIKIIRHEKNKGLGCARNTGLEHATGKYIACVDSDDWIDVTMLEKAVEKLEELDLDSVWVKVNTYLEQEDRYSTDNYYKGLFEQKGGIIEITKDNINSFPVNAWNKVYRADFIKQNKIHWSKGLLYEDLEFYYQFYTKSHKTYLIDELLYFYRWRTSSIMNQTNAGKCRCEDIYDVTKNIYDYLLRENIFEDYKIPFFRILERNIKLFLYNSHYHDRVLIASKNLLEKINFKENHYLGINDFVDKVYKFNTNKKPDKLKLFFINLIPFKNIRRNLRAAYKEEKLI